MNDPGSSRSHTSPDGAEKSPIVSSRSEGGSNHGGINVGSLIAQAAQQANKELQSKSAASSSGHGQPRKQRKNSRKNSRVDFQLDILDPEIELKAAETQGRDTEIYVGEDRSLGMTTTPKTDNVFKSDPVSQTSKPVKDSRKMFFKQESKSYNLPMPPAFALLEVSKPNKRNLMGSLWKSVASKRTWIWLSTSAFIIFMITALALFATFMVMNPRQPGYALSQVQVQWWASWKDVNGTFGQASSTNSSGSPVVYVYADAVLKLTAKNPNKNIIIKYLNTTLDVYYQDVLLGTAWSPGFKQEGLNTTLINVEWRCDGCPIREIGHYLEADEDVGAVPLTVKLTVDYRAKILGLPTPILRHANHYDITVKPPSVA